MVRAWSSGAAFAIATIGDETGETRVYDPGYPATLHDVTIERVIANTSGSDATGIGRVASVRYPPNECLADPPAELEPGSHLLLVLAPPDPSKDIWTVDGAASVLVLDDASGETATWEGSSPTCAGRVRYELSEITAAATSPAPDTAAGGTCLP
jgi:hypothetical protein